MKRRNAESGKLRRPAKRSKIAEGIYGSTFMYVKFVVVWAMVLAADFILEFRFEYLWPFYLLLRSVWDSFKYQGLAFSVFFVCVAVTSDVVCFLFIPVQWLFFAASTYVWVQYVWHTERGICLPTVSLWLLFAYIEASVRLREFKSLPYHLNLCRPFAAHCIGYPVVTLGFGFKSYLSYRIRVRKQKDVQNENDFYIQLLQKALPADQQTNNNEKQKVLPSKYQEEVVSNGSIVTSTLANTSTVSTSITAVSILNSITTVCNNTTTTNTYIAPKKSNKDLDKELNKKLIVNDVATIEDYEYIENSHPQKN